MNYFRHIRKEVAELRFSNNPFAQFTLNATCHAYMAADNLFLKRARRPDLNSEKLVSIDNGFFCCLTPKVASRTLLTGLQRSDVVNDLKIYERSIDAFKGIDPSFVKFALVRDPWSRAYSCYKQKVKDHNIIKQARHFNGRSDFNANMTFEEFINWLCSENGRDDVADRHWISQYRILGIDKEFEYDEIFHFSDLSQGWKKIASICGTSPSVFSHALKTSESEEYRDHFDRSMIRKIEERYSKDIELFGFSSPR